MSRIHIYFIKEIESDRYAIYRVESSDFNDNHINEPIARITINRDSKNYDFEPLGKLSRVKVVPPFVFDLPDSECEKILREQYADGYYYGGWTARMANVVRRILDSGIFPDEAYGIT